MVEEGWGGVMELCLKGVIEARFVREKVEVMYGMEWDVKEY